MIKALMHDPIFLAGKAEVATKEDLQVAKDLLDTLMVHRESWVGMAANMIGVRKRIIAFLDESGRAPTYTVMLNPEIIKKDGASLHSVLFSAMAQPLAVSFSKRLVPSGSWNQASSGSLL